MSSTLRITRALIPFACIGFCLAMPASTSAQAATEVKQQSSQITKSDVVSQLGAKSGMGQNEEFGLGSSLTATLVDPAKLAKLGITGVHEGARVSAMRIAPDKVRIEVDEMDPVPVTKKATLKLDEKGRLSAP